MRYILIGLLSFLIWAGADWATYKRIRFLKPFLWFAIIPIAAYAFIMAWLDSTKFYFPSTLSAIAWFTLLLFSGLFIYSVYIEIPLKTYTAQSQPTKVVIDGTYSLCRHPGALWFIGLLISTIFASKSINLTIAAPFWIAAYIGCIFWEDMLTSISDFSKEYRQYQKETPILIPTWKSFSYFWRGIRARFHR